MRKNYLIKVPFISLSIKSTDRLEPIVLSHDQIIKI